MMEDVAFSPKKTLMKNFFYHFAYCVFKILPECALRKLCWSAFCKFGFLAQAPDEWYWKLMTLIVAGEPYGLPGEGGGVNSVIRWQQIYWKSELPTLCADKYAVRDFVRSRIGEKYLVPLAPGESSYWTDPNQIDFCKLPQKFVLKLNNGSGMNLVVHDKKDIDSVKAVAAMKEWFNVDFSRIAREWHYKAIKPKIICETFIDTSDGAEPPDFKIMCSNGKPLFLWVDTDRYSGHKRNFFDLDFNPINAWGGFPINEKRFEKPKNLDEMLNVASRLSQGIPIVRVDLYNVDGRIYFGEMTFTPSQGCEIIKPLSQSQAWASQVDLAPFMKQL